MSKNRSSWLKREREQKKAQKTAIKRQKREDRRLGVDAPPDADLLTAENETPPTDVEQALERPLPLPGTAGPQ